MDASVQVELSPLRTEDLSSVVPGESGPSEIDAGNISRAITSEGRLFRPIGQVNRTEVTTAIVALVLSAALFAAIAPFAKTQLGAFPSFVPIYVSALVICDLITAVLLLSQYGFLRSRALLVLAVGYVFTGAMTFCYALIFPGLMTPTGLFGAGAQTTSAMYMFWHSGFPVLVIAYALLKRRADDVSAERRPRSSARIIILWSVAATLAVVIGWTVFATAGHALVPEFLAGNKTTGLGRTVLFGIWLLSLIALIVLWRHKPKTILDLWLMVVMCVWLSDIALAALLNSGRYDLGWYVGRAFGLVAASALLILLLVENASVYARLVGATIKLNAANQSFEQLSLHDALTGLANRRYLDSYLAAQIAVASRHKRPLALVLCDIDGFKAYNDAYGHLAGDTVLRQIAVALQSCCRRPGDLAARYGGEEFALILPDTDHDGAMRIAEMARIAVVELAIAHAQAENVACVTISGGVSSCTVGFELTAPQLIEAADENLFRAKRLGRNRMDAGRTVLMAVPNSQSTPDLFGVA